MTWALRATPETHAPTPGLTVTQPTPTTRCASATPAGWPKEPNVVSGCVSCTSVPLPAERVHALVTLIYLKS